MARSVSADPVVSVPSPVVSVAPINQTPEELAAAAMQAEPPDDMAPEVLKAIEAVNALLLQYPNRETVVPPGLHQTWRYLFVPLRGNKMLLITYETSLCQQEGKPPLQTVETLVETLPLNKFTEDDLLSIREPQSYNHRVVRSIYINHDSNMAELWKNRKGEEAVRVPPIVKGRLTEYQNGPTGARKTATDTLRPGFYLHLDDTLHIEEVAAGIMRVFELANPRKETPRIGQSKAVETPAEVLAPPVPAVAFDTPVGEMAPATLEAIKAVNAILHEHTYKKNENTTDDARHIDESAEEALPGKGNTLRITNYNRGEGWDRQGNKNYEAFYGVEYTIPLDKFLPGYLRVQGPLQSHDGPVKRIETFSVNDERVVGYRQVNHLRDTGPHPVEMHEDKPSLQSSFMLILPDEPWVDEVAAGLRKVLELGQAR